MKSPNFARNLKRLMTQQQMNVRCLSISLGVSTVTVQHWRNGTWEPKMTTAIRLARKLDTTVETLAT